MALRLKRAYEPPAPDDGARYLVDRLWPRGLTSEKLRLAAWRRELAPSEEVRRSYCHDPAKFASFRTAYRQELLLRPELIASLRHEIATGNVTLVFGARDVERSNAAVLAELLSEGRPRARTREGAVARPRNRPRRGARRVPVRRPTTPSGRGRRRGLPRSDR